MDIKDLKAGDKVFIREDLKDGVAYGDSVFFNEMAKGLLEVSYVSIECSFIQARGNSFYGYTPEMIDWDKTIRLRWMESLSGVYDEEDKQDNVHNPSHYGGGRKHNIECYKAMEYILDKLENVPEKYYGHVSNIVKYVWRCNDKNGYEDLDKASVYFDFMFREEE